MIHEVIVNGETCYTISSGRVYLPGVFENQRTARVAFRLDEETLTALQATANLRGGAQRGVITYGDVLRALGERRR